MEAARELGPSEVSSISAASDSDKMIQMKMKMKMKEIVSVDELDRDKRSQSHSQESNSHLLLDLKLSNNNGDSRRGSSTSELDIFNPKRPLALPAPPISSHANESSNQIVCDSEDKSKDQVYSCRFCNRKFSTSQALGGHQNAHKDQRTAMKLKQGVAFGGFGHSVHPPYSYPILPTQYPVLNASQGKSNLGIQREAMIRKPLHRCPIAHPGSRYHLDGGWLSGPDMMYQNCMPFELVPAQNSRYPQLGRNQALALGGYGSTRMFDEDRHIHASTRLHNFIISEPSLKTNDLHTHADSGHEIDLTLKL